MLQGQDVGVGQVGDMDIVADRRAVGRVIVFAEDAERAADAHGRLQGQRNGVGLGLMPLADPAFDVRAGGVEVA